MKTYGFSVEAGKDFERIFTLVSQELKSQGFGIVSDIDLQKIFNQKLGIDEGRYRILGVCNPSLAHQAIRAEADIGLLLPSNVVVRQDKEGFVTVAFAAPEALLGLLYRDDLVKLGAEIRNRFEKVRNAVLAEVKAAAAFSGTVA
jgi:uncharacterized protein (DUF302 family)